MDTLKASNKLTLVVGAVIIVLAVILGVVVLSHSSSNSSQSVVMPGPTASETLNKPFQFPIRDNSGKEISKFTYFIQNAELRDQILVKGEKATAIQGKTFLIINLKITNPYNKNVQINARDFIRASVDKKKEWLGADIHNDPVEVLAISTKYTRLGFTINNSDVPNLILQIGEITGGKTDIKLNL